MLSDFLLILLLLVANCIFALSISFVTVHLLKQPCLGGFWGASIVGLLGACLGSLIGVQLANSHIISNLFVYRYVFPGACALICEVLFVQVFKNRDEY